MNNQTPPEIRTACMILGLLPSRLTALTIDTVDCAWRQQMKASGIDQEVDQKVDFYLNTAKETLLRWIQERGETAIKSSLREFHANRCQLLEAVQSHFRYQSQSMKLKLRSDIKFGKPNRKRHKAMDPDRVKKLEREILRLKSELDSMKARNAAMMNVGLELRTGLISASGYTKLLTRRCDDIEPKLLADALDTLHSHLKDAVHQVCELLTSRVSERNKQRT